MVFTVVFSSPLAGAMGYGSHPEYIWWFGLILSFDALCAIPFANLRQKGNAKRFAIIKSVNIGVNIGLNLFFIVLCPVLLKNSILGEVIGWVYSPGIGVGYIFISNLIASLVTLLLLIPEMSKVCLAFDSRLWRKMFSYAWPLLILGFAGIINETFDRVILKHLLPSQPNPMGQLGIYGACYKISILMTIFIQTFKYAAEPFFFDQMKKQDAPRTYATVMNYFVAVCAFIFLAIMLFIDIALYFVGPDFRSGAPVIPILLLANLFLGIFYNLTVWFKITGHTLYGAMVAVAGMIITLVMNFVLVPVMGYMGAAWATFICYAFMMIISYIIGRRYYPVPYNIPRIAGYILSAVGMYQLSNLLPDTYKVADYALRFLMLGAFALLVLWIERGRKLAAPKL